ncbi:MAG: flagellar protein FlgN [Phycisphaerae bacterium]|nr:flagellar protein FlgN [Phycisphaerae bacterium]
MTGRGAQEPDSRNPDGQSPEAVARQLEASLSEQLGLLGQLDALGQRQSRLIDEDDPDRLLEVLAERQAVIDRMEGCARRLVPLQQRWDVTAGTTDAGSRDRIRQRLESIAGLIDAIDRRDAHDRERLEDRRREIARELGELDRSRRATGAYTPPPTERPRFRDEEA